MKYANHDVFYSSLVVTFALARIVSKVLSRISLGAAATMKKKKKKKQQLCSPTKHEAERPNHFTSWSCDLDPR